MFSTICLCILVIIMLYVYYVQNYSRLSKEIRKFPGPSVIPILGSIHVLGRNEETFFYQLRELAKKYKSTYSLWSAHVAALNLIRAEDVEVLLSNNKYIDKSFIYDFLHDWLGEGLLVSTGKKWQQRRKLLTNSFHFNILQKFIETFGEHSERLVEKLLDANFAFQTNIVPIMSKTTLEIISETAMGTILNLRNKEQSSYFQSIYKIVDILFQRILRPWYYNKWCFKLSLLNFQQWQLIRTLHGFTNNVINDREENFQDDFDDDLELTGKKKLAMLDMLISAKRKFGVIDNNGIREEVDTFMFEGHDTTTSALCFTMMLLANNKQHQKIIYEEQRQIFGDSLRAAAYDELQQMVYLEYCIKESLRLYPPVPFISRCIKEDMKLGELTAPAGCIINVHIYDLHRDPKYFPDPDKFDPDRFLPENVKTRHPFAYIPFSAGSRNCIGQKFAMLEMKCILSAVLRNYELNPITTPRNIPFKVDLVLRTCSPIYIKFKKRK